MQIFPALAVGAMIFIADKDSRKDPTRLAEIISGSSITVTYFTPTHFSMLLDTSSHILLNTFHYRLAFFGGERLPPELITSFYRLRNAAIVYNMWGPSEMAVQCTAQMVTESALRKSHIPIGYPFHNCRVYILDSNLSPVPVGVAGEICLAGPQTASGYLNRPEETNDKFHINPYASGSDKEKGWTNLHRSGDKGCFLPSGNIEFRGRLSGDKQIKLRGLRIDLGEVEQALLKASGPQDHRQISSISVIARDPSEQSLGVADDRQIIAFLVLKQGNGFDKAQQFIDDLHKTASATLNGYMLPSGYELIETLPTTIGGKLDIQNLSRRKLRLIFPSVRPRSASSSSLSKISAIDLQTSNIVDKISSIFATILHLPQETALSSEANFFDLGGQSVQLVRLQRLVNRLFKLKIPLPVLFSDPTPLGVALVLRDGVSKESRSSDSQPNLDWEHETNLPDDPRYYISASKRMPRQQMKNILMTGPESFAGIHVLARLLKARPYTQIYVLGSVHQVTNKELESLFRKYDLLDHIQPGDSLAMRLRPLEGSLAQPHFGISHNQFKDLGASLHAIYHLGTEVSILKSYTQLKYVNVRGTLDIIELASYGQYQTEIHFGSTQSVVHLQTWNSTILSSRQIVLDEEVADHFTPEANIDNGYFKSRWVAEILMTKAARRGFPIAIYRFSAVTASTDTRIHNPTSDILPLMARQIILSRRIPDFVDDRVQFALDFVPVNYMAAALCDLSTHEAVRDGGATARGPVIYHVCNPKSMTIHDLSDAIRAIVPENGKETMKAVPKDQWAKASMAAYGNMQKETKLRLDALQTYFDHGHVMFSLSCSRTLKSLRDIDSEALESCPPVDWRYLQGMMAEVTLA